ncbi:ATP-binding protein [Pseudomonas sp. NC02]|uniref:ATP-binding protein n=1 Tax=Pseudomonas sp. NC02 TaxID=2067572 RepID=UPI000C836E69|nr:ATP-binding protein [Pseudomonas sp. NC02]AUO23455.1 histidine kinase [Pseudomonas sp. NC02]
MMTRNRVRWGTSLCLLMAATWANAGARPPGPDLSVEERVWIEHHPVLRVAVVGSLSPIEYVENGRLKGLSAEYLQLIAHKTGMKIDYVSAHSIQDRIELLMTGKADLISTVRLNGPGGKNPRLLLTSAYLNTTTVIITRIGRAPLFEAEQLDRLTVTLPYFDRYSDFLATKAPGAKLIIGGSALTMLQQVAEGTADAAVATEAYLLPFLYRQFQGQLQISGVLTGMASQIAMGTRKTEPLLHSIIQKTLDSVTPDEVRVLHANWLREHATPDLPLREVVSHYPHEIALIVLVVVLLLITIYQTQRMRQRAERNEREKAMFLAVMSHEIRSPMNAVVAAVELLRNTPLDKQQQHFADLANHGAQSLLRLLNDVLDISKLDAGQVKLEYEPVSISTLVHNVVDLHRLRAREKHLSICVNGESHLPLLMLDSTRIGQVLHNLLSNAIKFTEIGGVEVTYAISDLASSRNKELRLTVTDTGIGLSQESQARLFQPYSQAAQSYKRSGGTGLGLVICRDLLKLMGGTLTLDSSPGKGTRVELSLTAELAPPDSTEAETVLPATNWSATSAPKALRILVVEDTVANQAVLQAQIEGFGCTPVIARDGAQAVDCFEQGTYDLILMDCDLPDQDGYSLTRLFRMIEQDAAQTRCPIIAISASTGNQHVARCFDAGMDGILSKPISLGKLQDAIELWCGVTLTLLPHPFALRQPVGHQQILEALERDLLALLEGMVLRNLEPALHAAHRLHGAALSIEWPDVARQAGQLEALLRTATPWSDPTCATTLQALLHGFRSTSFSHPVFDPPVPPAAD